MPNIQSKKKRLKQNKKINLANKSFKSKMNTSIKKANNTKDVNDINYAVSLVDSAVSKNILKKENAAREKSKLHSLTNTKTKKATN